MDKRRITKVDSFTDKEFIDMVNDSLNMKELGEKLGYSGYPSPASRRVILERMDSLNLQFTKIPTIKKRTFQEEHTYDNFNSTIIGGIGEAHFEYEMASLGVITSKVTIDNAGYDYVMDYNGRLYKIQVKSSLSNNGEYVSFDLTRVVKIQKEFIHRTYEVSDVDYFYLYDILKKRGYLVENNGQGSILLRYTYPMNHQVKNINFYDDFLTKRTLNKIGPLA